MMFWGLSPSLFQRITQESLPSPNYYRTTIRERWFYLVGYQRTLTRRKSFGTWLQYTRNNTLKKENFDQTDAYCAVLGHMKSEKIW